jgi:hypothetical protein
LINSARDKIGSQKVANLFFASFLC